MSKESKPKRTRSTKKISEEDSSHTAELEAKIAELEAKLTNLSSQVKPSEAKQTHTAPPPAPKPSSSRGTLPAGFNAPPQSTHKETPKPEPAKPRPAASGPTHGTLPAGFKAPPPTPKEAPRTSSSYSTPDVGEVAPAYAQISSTTYTGNKYFATRPRLSYHPVNKQFKGQATTTSTSTTTAPPPPPPAPAPKPSSSRGTLPAGTTTTEAEKKSLWKAKGSEYENYVSEEETHKAPPPPPAPKPSSSRGTLPAGFNAPPPPPAPKEVPKPEPAKPRPTASGPTHGTLPAGFKAPQPETREEPKTTTSYSTPDVGEVAPAYAQISSTGYTGNKYFATRPRLSYHPANKQFTGSKTTAAAPPAPAPTPKKTRGTLPAGFKP